MGWGGFNHPGIAETHVAGVMENIGKDPEAQHKGPADHQHRKNYVKYQYFFIHFIIFTSR